MTDFSRDPTDGVVVFERDPYWGPEFKRQLAGDWLAVRECRRLADLAPAAATLTRAVLIVVLDAAPAEFLTWLERRDPSSCESAPAVVVIASAGLADLEWPIREAGVQAFISDGTPGDRVARLCRRLIRRPLVTRHE